ncbi:hypothetical protein [Nocardia sp. NPDC020380]|uniref:hypothetical protein n=1 Tax=Nocardia sp. NPDC020380 TaxID=3364309 RepID=UPI0037AEE97A
MNPTPAPLRRRSLRRSSGTLLAAFLVVIGLIAAVAEWGAAQAVPAGSLSVPVVHTTVEKAPFCGKGNGTSADPVGKIAAPPRSVGDPLITASPAVDPGSIAAQWLSHSARSRAPALTVPAPHLTSILII